MISILPFFYLKMKITRDVRLFNLAFSWLFFKFMMTFNENEIENTNDLKRLN